MCGSMSVSHRGGWGGGLQREITTGYAVLFMWWRDKMRGENERVVSDRNQWARLFGGLSESIILLSCCLVAEQRGGQGEEQNVGLCHCWARVNRGSVQVRVRVCVHICYTYVHAWVSTYRMCTCVYAYMRVCMHPSAHVCKCTTLTILKLRKCHCSSSSERQI